LVKAAAKAQKARDRLGSDNVKAAVTLSGAASLFTNIYMAMGFFMRLAEKPLGEAEQRALESRGREFFGLGRIAVTPVRLAACCLGIKMIIHLGVQNTVCQSLLQLIDKPILRKNIPRYPVSNTYYGYSIIAFPLA
jgi:hypothetical protein